MRILTIPQPTLSFAIHLHGRLVVLAPFPYLFGSLRQPGSAPASSCSGQAIEVLLACIILDGMLHFALHVPKPMFVFEFEGALLAFIVNGDRFVLFALLPRRKPRTSRDSAAALSFQRTQPHQRRLLRFACAIWPLAWISCVLWQWHRCHT